MSCDRRTFLHTGLAGAACLGSWPLQSTLVEAQPTGTGKQAAAGESETYSVQRDAAEIAVFTKSFQAWPLEQVCQKFKDLGVTGLDLTVRPGGHVLPDRIRTDLPQAAETVAQHGLKIVQITSNVTTDDQYGRDLFETAGELGIRRIKLGYYRDDPQNSNLRGQLKQVQKKLRTLAKLVADQNVLPCVHIHSGGYLPSHGTLLYLMLQEFEPGELGAYVDTLHMSLEGGGAGWRQGLQLLAPWITLCAVKNYVLTEKPRDQAGQQRWGWKNCPLADGVSPLPDFMKTLQQLGYRGPFSLHSEYVPELTVEECYAQTAADLAYFRTILPA